MSYSIDPAVLESIAQEARQCFLEEDAPGYLEALQQGLQQIADGASPDYRTLMRAAHSVKGGAGVAQMPGLSTLAHKLEDLLEAWNEERIADVDSALVLMQQGLEVLTDLLEAARSQGIDLEPDPNLLRVLDDFLGTLNAPTSEVATLPSESLSPAKKRLIRTALESDLETCLTTLSDRLPTQSESLQDTTLPDRMATFLDECLLIGEAYSLPWIVQTVEETSQRIEAESPSSKKLVTLARQTIEALRRQREVYLKELDSATEASSVSSAESHSPSIGDDRTPTELQNGRRDERGDPVPTPSKNHPLTSSVTHQQLRIPLERIDRMSSLVGELIVSHERLTLQQRQLRQASQNLRRIVEQVKPVRDDVQTLYDRMSTVERKTEDEAIHTEEFDALEMDRYTALHSSLQTFEELIAQVQETRIDIDIVNRELAQDLGLVRRDLDRLYNEVTTSRLVPFQAFAQRFVPQLQRITQRCGKKTTLDIEGENVLVDKVLLEQLQTPLTHILNNALDHGIEKPEDRRALDKPETARITLHAQTEGSEVAISIADDGRGIDLESVYRKAIDRGLCPAHVAMSQLPRETLLNFIFQPGFSTAEQVSDISGRGVGMDIVRTQVQQLRGNVEVDTVTGKGTTFSIRLPLSLSLLPVLLCQVGQQVVAIPSDTILDVLPYDDVVGMSSAFGASPADETAMTWRGQVLPLYLLWGMLPYNTRVAVSTTPRVVLILKGASAPMAVAVDGIADERQLVLKPFDDMVPVPPYVAGCVILGTGEAVPAILPRFLKPVSQQKAASAPPTRIVTARTILVAEDSTGARRSLERILTSSGFVVIPCRDGQEAWRKLEQRQGSVDLVVTDIEMPLLNGFDLLSRIRSHSRWYGLPTVVLTSRTGDRHRQKAKSLGANAYLGKPVTPTELLSSIDNLLKAPSL
ncbi:MAG: response regulator [Cyanobacteria bacterium SID2]|nr:response regulator [Cyanobacteria bacterium SID2]MBP0004701.1 response regulator [Cyanobacteria bacterium SBC]